MADFFSKLGQDIKDGWDDVKDKVEDGFDDLKKDAKNLTSQAEASEFAGDKTPTQKFEEAEAAGIVEGMIKGDTLTSPCDSTILTAAHTPGHWGVSMANSLGVIVAIPDDLQDQVTVLVKPDEQVKKGTPLMKFTQKALDNCTIDLVEPVVEEGYEGEPERIIRVFGPIKPEE